MPTSTLAPGLLLAAPSLGDPNFERTVVLVGHHDADGALGWVLNGRGLVPVHQLLRDASLIPPGVALPDSASFSAMARVGGPVMSGSAWLIFERPPTLAPYENEHDLGRGFFATGARAAIEAVARASGPSFFRLVLGYAGWGPGQLENEIRRGSWLPADLDHDLLRDHGADNLWGAAYKGVGATPFGFTSHQRGSA